MSDYIPIEIQINIINRLPVKSLIQYRSVSSAWKDLIDSPEFIAQYSLTHAHQQQCHLVKYQDPLETHVTNYISFIDDESFPRHYFAPAVPRMVHQFTSSRIVGSSGGLLCLYGGYQEAGDRREMALLWNPSVQRSVGVSVPNALVSAWCHTVIGFGVCPGTNDPKIVKITQITNWWDIENVTPTPRKLQVFTLSSGVWKTACSNLLTDSVEVKWSQVAIGSFIYWLAFDRITMVDGFWSYNMVLSFDLASEELKQVVLPNLLALQPDSTLSITNLGDSLAVLEYDMLDTYKQVWAVWVMENGETNTFTKLLVIEAPETINCLLGFRNDWQPIVEFQDNYQQPAALAVYESESERINYVGIQGRLGSFYLTSYMESLLLLDHLDGSVY